MVLWQRTIQLWMSIANSIAFRTLNSQISTMGLLQIQQVHSRLKHTPTKGFARMFLVGVSLSVVTASCSTANSSSSNNDVELTLASYSVTRSAYEQIISDFAAKWKQEHNQNVIFYRSYGSSGSQTRAVSDGLEADVVSLALALDTKKIEKAGLIAPGWEKEAPNNSIVTKSVVVLVTRDGNPKNIETWTDLIKDDVRVITANPKTSGGARWNFLALWGSALQEGEDTKALEYTTKVYKNVLVLPRDAREASDVFFKQGQGDVLVNYENEAILAGQKGEKLPYVVPEVNISIDNPVAVVDKNVDKHGNREVAEAFVEYLFTPEAQREFAKIGFRPVNHTVEKELANQYPKVKTLFTAANFGDWNAIQKKFFDDTAIFDRIQARIK